MSEYSWLDEDLRTVRDRARRGETQQAVAAELARGLEQVRLRAQAYTAAIASPGELPRLTRILTWLEQQATKHAAIGRGEADVDTTLLDSDEEFPGIESVSVPVQHPALALRYQGPVRPGSSTPPDWTPSRIAVAWAELFTDSHINDRPDAWPDRTCRQSVITVLATVIDTAAVGYKIVPATEVDLGSIDVSGLLVSLVPGPEQDSLRAHKSLTSILNDQSDRWDELVDLAFSVVTHNAVPAASTTGRWTFADRKRALTAGR